MKKILFALCLIASLSACSSQPCRDENGKEVSCFRDRPERFDRHGRFDQ